MKILLKTIFFCLIVTIILLMLSVILSFFSQKNTAIPIVNNYFIGLFCSMAIVDITTGIQIGLARSKIKNNFKSALQDLILDLPDSNEKRADILNVDEKEYCAIQYEIISRDCKIIEKAIKDYSMSKRRHKKFANLHYIVFDLQFLETNEVDYFNKLIDEEVKKEVVFESYKLFKNETSTLNKIIVEEYEKLKGDFPKPLLHLEDLK